MVVLEDKLGSRRLLEKDQDASQREPPRMEVPYLTQQVVCLSGVIVDLARGAFPSTGKKKILWSSIFQALGLNSHAVKASNHGGKLILETEDPSGRANKGEIHPSGICMVSFKRW